MPIMATHELFEKLAKFPIRVFEEGDVVLSEGSTTGRLLFLKSGAVDVVMHEVDLTRVDEPGAVFGDIGLLLGEPHTADVVAVPAKGVERWLAQRLSHVLGTPSGDGVCANVDFPWPSTLVDEALAASSAAHADAVERWAPARSVWPLLDVVDDAVATESWARTLARHLGAATPDGGGGEGTGRRLAVARRLGCAQVVIPEVGAALSAAGALMSDLSAEYATMSFATSERFATETVNQVLADLQGRCRKFMEGPGAGALEQAIEYAVEARYPHQIWEIEVPLRVAGFGGPEDVDALVADFHAAHHELFEISDPNSGIELVTWRARVGCRLRHGGGDRLVAGTPGVDLDERRQVYFADHGWVEAAVRRFEAVGETSPLEGPAIVESSFTTVVIDPGARARRSAS